MKKRKKQRKGLTDREFKLGSIVFAVGIAVNIAFFGFSYSVDPQGVHGEITTASTVLSVLWIAVTLAASFLLSFFLDDRSFLYGFSVYLALSLVVPFLYGFCASLYPAYGLIGYRLFSGKMLENMPDSSLIFEPLRIAAVYALYFFGRYCTKKRKITE